MADTMTNYADTAEFQAEVNEFFAKFDAIGDLLEAEADAREGFWERWGATMMISFGLALFAGGTAGMVLKHLA